MQLRVIIAVAPICASAAASAANPARYMDAKLVAATAVPKPGSKTLVGFEMTPQPGWHGYWSNPGDSGIPPTVRWSAPAGVSFGPLLHPAPTLLVSSGISSFVHAGPHVLLSRMSMAPSVAPGTHIPVKANLSWAACTETQCIPLHEVFTLDLVAGDGAPGPAASVLDRAFGKLPRSSSKGTFSIEANRVRLVFPTTVRLSPATTRFFPDRNGIVAAARSQTVEQNGSVVIVAPSETSAIPSSISGVATDGTAAYRIAFRRVEAQPEASDPKPSAPTAVNPMPVRPPTKRPHLPTPAGTSEPQPPTGADPSPPAWIWLMAIVAAALFGSAAMILRRK